MTCLKLFFISACDLVVGTAAVSVVMSWPNPEAMLSSILFAPLMAIAGWVMIFIILALVALMWLVRVQRLLPSAWLFVSCGGLLGGVVCLLLLAHGPTLQWRVAVVVGGLVSGLASNALTLLLITESPNQTLKWMAVEHAGFKPDAQGPPPLS